MKYLILILSLVLTSACAETIPLHGTVSLDSKFSPEETGEILSAADQWKQATGMISLTFNVSDEAESSEYAIVRRDGINHHRGVTTQTPSRVLIEIWPGDVYNTYEYMHGIPGYGSVEEIALHELGHSFGLFHQSTGLMKAGGVDHILLPACIDSHTLSSFCALYDCKTVRPTCPD
jgi:hypothetical protein